MKITRNIEENDFWSKNEPDLTLYFKKTHK